MFYPQAMTEIELIVPSKDLLAVTKVLSGEGVFQQADTSYMSAVDGNKPDHSWQERAGAYASLERRIQSIMQAIDIEEGNPPSKDIETMADLSVVQPTIDQIEQEVRSVSDRQTEQQKRLEQLDNILLQIEPIADVDVDISQLRSPRYLFSILGAIPADNVDRMQTSLSRIPHVFMNLRQDSHKAVVWLAGSRNHADILDRAARSAYLNPISLPDEYQGTPAQIIETVRASSADARQQITTLDSQCHEMGKKYQQQLHALLWEIRASRQMADAIVRFGRLKYTYLIVGWALSSHLESLTTRIKQVSKDTLIQVSPLKRGDGAQTVPVALRNPRFLRPFQTLVTTYARPQYNEIDPTLLIAITFPLLFGAMFGDVGQGLVLALLGGLLTSRRVKALRSMAGLGGLVIACGLSAMVFGVLYGSIFGFEHVIPALWLHPLENIMEILILAIGAGVVLLIFGFIIGLFNAWVARDWGHFFFDRNGLAGFLLYISLIVFVVQAFTGQTFVPRVVLLVIAGIAGAVVMVSEVLKRLVEGHRPLVPEGIGTYAIQAGFELFETLISFLSNSLSYVRVGAFAVAHAGLSQVIFILAGLTGPGYWIVVILGNLFIIGFEGLIVGIQTMRLEYYEFFSKFFRGGGMRYEPLTLRPSETE